jgi:hypothetical protein
MFDPEALVRAASAALARGEFTGASEAFEDAARQYLQTLLVDEGILAAVAAARASLQAGDPIRAEVLLEPLGPLAASCRGHGAWLAAWADAGDALRSSAEQRARWLSVRTGPDARGRARAALRLGEIARADGDLLGAAASLTSARQESETQALPEIAHAARLRLAEVRLSLRQARLALAALAAHDTDDPVAERLRAAAEEMVRESQASDADPDDGPP